MENLKLIVDTYDKLQVNGLCKDLALMVFDFAGDLTETEDELLKKQIYLKLEVRNGRKKYENHFCRLCNHSEYLCLYRTTNHISSHIHQENVKKYHDGELDLMSNEELLKKYFLFDHHSYDTYEQLEDSIIFLSNNMVCINRRLRTH